MMNVAMYAKAMLDCGREFDEMVSAAVQECNDRIGKARAVYEEKRSEALSAFMDAPDEPVAGPVPYGHAARQPWLAAEKDTETRR